MKLLLLDGDNKMEFSIGSAGIHGEHIGDNPDSLESECINII
jgi:hypothetical protein